jgi:hypothetical protein
MENAMTKCAMLIVLMLSVAVNGQTTQPAATQPAVPDLKKYDRETLELLATQWYLAAAATQAENTELKNRLTKLETDLRSANRQVSQPKAVLPVPAAPSKVVLDEQEKIATAIKEHRITDGMTLEQASKAVSLKFTKMSSDSDGDVYYSNDAKQQPFQKVGQRVIGGDLVGTEYTLTMRDGRITRWNSRPFRQSAGTATSQ